MTRLNRFRHLKVRYERHTEPTKSSTCSLYYLHHPAGRC